MTLTRRLRLYALEAKYEVLKQFRMPMYIFFSLGFPVMFYTLFGTIFGRRSGTIEGVPFSAYYLATYGAFSLVQGALFTFGVGLATERAQGWLVLKRASPMPLEAYFLAKLTMSLVSAVTIVALLTLCGVFIVGLHMPLAMYLRLVLTMIAGVLPFCALGLAIGYWAGPNTAPGAVDLINMPMSIASGLWMPLSILPVSMQHAAVWLPPYHYGQLALAAIGQQGDAQTVQHVAVLLGFGAACLLLARVGYRRHEEKAYG